MSKRTKNKIDLRIFFPIIFLFVIFVTTPKVLAATINLNPANGLYKVGDTIEVEVSINSNTIVNAVAAKISYPKNLLTLSSISKDKTIVSLWAQEPLYSNIEGIASFEGVILYGHTGDKGKIATLIFKAKSVGVAELKFNTASILAHDGDGTEVLSGKNGSLLTIVKGTDSGTPLGEIKGSTLITIKEINEEDNYSRSKFFITTDRDVKDQLYSIQIDSMNPIMWIDDGSHIFETPLLDEGVHTIRIMAADNDLNLLSGSLDFTTKILKIPTVTYYPDKVRVGEPIIIRGLADPKVDVEFISTNKETKEVTIGHAGTNIDGKFTYIPENENEAGVYTITARALAKNGIWSGYMNSIEIEVSTSFFGILVSKIMKLIAILMPYLILILIFILLIIYAIYRVKRYQLYLKRKLKEKEIIVGQEFEKFDDDPKESIRSDIKETKDIIEEGMKDLEKDVDNL